jgi:uncharacterized repeat protein (TIGR01451 family)
VTVLNDVGVEGIETVSITLNSITSGDADITIATASATLDISDNDTATISFTTAASNAPEATTPHIVGVTLLITSDGVAGTGTLARDVSVNVQDLLTGSASMADYLFSSPETIQWLTGDAGSTRNVSLAILPDNLSEGNETVNLALNTLSDGTSGQVSLVAPSVHSVTILDDDVDLLVTKTESAPRITAGAPGNLTYTVTVRNVGLTNATGVVLSELLTLPAGVSVLSVTPSAGGTVQNSPTDFTWNLGNLASGGSATLTVVLRVAASTAAGTDVIGNTASITAAPQNLINPADDTATERTSVDRKVDLSLRKTANRTSARPGQTIVYTLTYGNLGPSDASGVRIIENIPGYTRFNAAASTPGWTIVGTTATFNLGRLSAGTTGRTVQFAVTVNNPLHAIAKSVRNTSSINHDNSAMETVLGNNTSSVITSVNSKPVATADAYTAIMNRPLTVAASRGLLANDRDADGDRLQAVLVRGPSVGTLRLNADGSFIYYPRLGYRGLVTFTYRVFDGFEYNDPITVTINVQLGGRRV